MSDLRSACIEAMAEATVTRAIGRGAWPRPDDAATQMWRSDAANSLDALLGVLEDHAALGVWVSLGDAVGDLLSVLREDR